MHVGVMMFPTDKSIQPVQLATEVESRGFESLWFPEHSHIPTSRKTPWGGFKGMPALPEEYCRTHDQFVALAACAAVTERIKIGTGVCLVAQRDPIWLAKEVATLDQISEGRFLFGIGYGWNREEMSNHGLDFNSRRKILREKILLMKEIWANDEPSFSGEHIEFSKSWAWPKPYQKPHPPILMGGAANSSTLDHIVEFCDGWMPIGGAHDLFDGIHKMRAACEKVGRDSNSVDLGLFGAKAESDFLKKIEEAGVSRAILGLPPAPADKVLPLLDRYTAFL